MAKLGQSFDSNQHEPREASFDPLPPGWYGVTIVESEMRENSNRKGSHLWLAFELIESLHPDLKGRHVWARLNLYNQNQTAVEIAQRELSTICRSVGVPVVDDSEQLHNKPLALKVKLRPATRDYDANNEVTGYDAAAARFPQLGGGSTATRAPTPTTAPGAAATGKPPWAQ